MKTYDFVHLVLMAAGEIRLMGGKERVSDSKFESIAAR